MRYKVELFRNKKKLFFVEIENVDRSVLEENLDLVLKRFPPGEGYENKVLFSDCEIRYLKSTNQNIEILATKPVYQEAQRSSE